jgi:hypothetical protein
VWPTRKNEAVSERGDTQPVDDGGAIHYAAVERGTPVYSSDGIQVGRVREMLDNYREHIFDGVVFEDGAGTLRFADAPEVARTAERAVTLAIDAEEAGRLGPPEKGEARFVPNLSRGRMSRLFGRGWKRR